MPHTLSIFETGSGFRQHELERHSAFELGQMVMTHGRANPLLWRSGDDQDPG